MLVGDGVGLDHPDRLLHLIAPGEVRPQGTVHGLDVPGFDPVQIVIPGRADPPLHDLQLASVDLAGGEDEPQELVGGLGPAVPVVGPRRHLRRDHLQPARPDEALVVVPGVVGAGGDHPADALLEGRPIDVVGERHVLVLGPELRVAVVLPGVGAEPRRAHIRAVDHRVGPAEMAAVRVAVGLSQVGDHDARDRLPVPGRASGVDRDQLPPLAQFPEHALADVSGRPGQDHSAFAHRTLSTRTVPAIRTVPAVVLFSPREYYKG